MISNSVNLRHSLPQTLEWLSTVDETQDTELCRTLQFTKPFRSDQGASATTILLSSSQQQFHFRQAWVTCGFKNHPSLLISLCLCICSSCCLKHPSPAPHICQARTFLPFCHTSFISQFSIPCYLSFFPLYYSLKDKDNV